MVVQNNFNHFAVSNSLWDELELLLFAETLIFHQKSLKQQSPSQFNKKGGWASQSLLTPSLKQIKVMDGWSMLVTVLVWGITKKFTICCPRQQWYYSKGIVRYSTVKDNHEQFDFFFTLRWRKSLKYSQEVMSQWLWNVVAGGVALRQQPFANWLGNTHCSHIFSSSDGPRVFNSSLGPCDSGLK